MPAATRLVPAANPTASFAGEPALNEYSGEPRATTRAATPISSPPNPVNFRAVPLHTSSIIPHAVRGSHEKYAGCDKQRARQTKRGLPVTSWCRWAAAVLVVTAAAGCGAPGNKAGGQSRSAPVVVSLAHALDDAAVQPFVDQVSLVSHGSIRIETRSVPRTAGGDDDATVLDAVRSGRADLGMTSTVLAPLGIDSLAMEERVLRSDMAKEITAPAGLVSFGLLPGPLIPTRRSHAAPSRREQLSRPTCRYETGRERPRDPDRAGRRTGAQ